MTFNLRNDGKYEIWKRLRERLSLSQRERERERERNIPHFHHSMLSVTSLFRALKFWFNSCYFNLIVLFSTNEIKFTQAFTFSNYWYRKEQTYLSSLMSFLFHSIVFERISSFVTCVKVVGKANLTWWNDDDSVTVFNESVNTLRKYERTNESDEQKYAPTISINGEGNEENLSLSLIRILQM